MLVLAYDKLPDHTHVTKFDNKTSRFELDKLAQPAASIHQQTCSQVCHAFFLHVDPMADFRLCVSGERATWSLAFPADGLHLAHGKLR